MSAVSHPGIDSLEFQDVSARELPGFWVVYAGNPDSYQNLDVLMKAMKRIPHVGLLLVSASNLDRWKGSGLPRLRCVQTSDFNEVCSYIASADVAVLPREVCSGFPIKLLNYLALGIPTVCAEGSSIDLPGVIPFPNGCDRTMAGRINELLNDHQQCRLLGNRARKYVLEHYTWEVQAKKLESIYSGCLQKFQQ